MHFKLYEQHIFAQLQIVCVMRQARSFEHCATKAFGSLGKYEQGFLFFYHVGVWSFDRTQALTLSCSEQKNIKDQLPLNVLSKYLLPRTT